MYRFLDCLKIFTVTFALLFSMPGWAFAQTTQSVQAVTVTGWTSRDIAFLISPLISLIGVAIIVFFTRKSAVSEQWLKINEAEANYLQNKLDKFYGPFTVASEANYLLAQDLRSRQPIPDGYRLLDKLFDAKWREDLPAGDRELVREICETGERLSTLIKENIGLVDPKIIPYIARSLAHFRILKLAYDQKLGDNSSPFLRYVYPHQLDSVLNLELERLQRRVMLLRKEPTKSHGEMVQLDLSSHELFPWNGPDGPNAYSNSGKSLNQGGSSSTDLTIKASS